MKLEQIKSIFLEEIGNIAPEIEPAAIRPDADLREELDIDSIGFLNLVIALSNRLGFDIPESDYRRMDSLAHAVDYLSSRASHIRG